MKAPADSLKVFAVCAPGLEPYAAQELRQLGVLLSEGNFSSPQDAGEEEGGIEFSATLPDIYHANLHLRTASRILVRLGEFYAAAFSELRKKAGRLPWERYLKPGRPVAFHVTCRKSRLYHSDAVAERIRGAIQDHLGVIPPVVKAKEESDSPQPQLVVVRLVHDLCTISIKQYTLYNR